MTPRWDDNKDELGDHRRARDPSPARAKLVEAYEDPIDKQARQAESIDDRVLAIAYLITQGRWSNLKILQYANLWAVSIETVRGYAKDAARFQRLLKGKKEFAAHVREVDAQLRTAYELAIANGDAKGAVAAAKARGELHGVFAPKKIAATTADGKDAPAAVPQAILALADHELATRYYALTGRRPTPDQVAQLDAGVSLLDVVRQAGLLPGGLPDCANLCHTEQAMAEKKPTEPSAPSAPVPPPEVAPAVTPPSLGAALAAAAKETKLSGHQLLGQLASLNGIPEEMGRAMHDLAFAVNTGLAGHKAPDGLKKLSPEALAALVQEVIEGALDVPAVTALLRERFPEPPRVQLPY